jgi:hypothetical protein
LHVLQLDPFGARVEVVQAWTAGLFEFAELLLQADLVGADLCNWGWGYGFVGVVAAAAADWDVAG